MVKTTAAMKVYNGGTYFFCKIVTYCSVLYLRRVNHVNHKLWLLGFLSKDESTLYNLENIILLTTFQYKLIPKATDNQTNK